MHWFKSSITLIYSYDIIILINIKCIIIIQNIKQILPKYFQNVR